MYIALLESLQTCTVSGKEAASAGFGIVALALVSKSENARPPSFTCTGCCSLTMFHQTAYGSVPRATSEKLCILAQVSAQKRQAAAA